MSYEQKIREQHAFEDRLRFFLLSASVMTDREIELALARLADSMGASEHALFNGQVLKLYYDLRRAGAKKHRSFKRMLYTPVPGMPPQWPAPVSFTEYMVSGIAKFPLLGEGQRIEGGALQKALVALAP